MDFFARQAAARRQSRWLLLAFAVAVLLVVLALTWVVLALFGSQADLEAVYGGGAAMHPLDYGLRNPDLAVSTALFWLLIILGASAWKGLLLRGGGGVVARSLGGVRIERGSQDEALRRLHNVVEEMAIASGIPMPEVYVMESEAGINAFAAGHSPANAAVAVTRGALERLSREELQGVVAHEFSHVLNGDMRLNIRLIGWLFGLLVIAIIGRTVLRLAPRGRRGAPAALGLGLAMLVLGYVGLACGRIIQAAVCRQRERLADAAAVQFTRNPGGLKGALLQIAGLPVGGRLAAGNCDEVAHLLFAPGISRWLSTHPPLAERISALDPAFPVRQLDQLATEAVRAGERRMQLAVSRDAELAAQRAAASGGSTAATGAAGAPTTAAALASVAARFGAALQGPGQLTALVGQPGALHFERARELRESLPEAIRNFAGSPAAARALVLASLLGAEAQVRASQLDAIEAELGAGARADLAAAAAVTTTLHPLQRLPALQGLFPVLRRLPREQRIALTRLIATLAAADRSVDMYEFCLGRLVFNALLDELEARAPHGNAGLATSFRHLGVLFSVLAAHGASDDATARAAFDAGVQPLLPLRQPEFALPPDWQRPLWSALTQLEQLQPIAKRQLIEALSRTIAHDGLLTVAEAELLQTVCAVLQCPLPPLLASSAGA